MQKVNEQTLWSEISPITKELPQHTNPQHMTDRRLMDMMGEVLPIKLRSEKTMQSKSGGKNTGERERERNADTV